MKELLDQLPPTSPTFRGASDGAAWSISTLPDRLTAALKQRNWSSAQRRELHRCVAAAMELRSMAKYHNLANEPVDSDNQRNHRVGTPTVSSLLQAAPLICNSVQKPPLSDRQTSLRLEAAIVQRGIMSCDLLQPMPHASVTLARLMKQRQIPPPIQSRIANEVAPGGGDGFARLLEDIAALERCRWQKDDSARPAALSPLVNDERGGSNLPSQVGGGWRRPPLSVTTSHPPPPSLNEEVEQRGPWPAPASQAHEVAGIKKKHAGSRGSTPTAANHRTGSSSWKPVSVRWRVGTAGAAADEDLLTVEELDGIVGALGILGGNVSTTSSRAATPLHGSRSRSLPPSRTASPKVRTPQSATLLIQQLVMASPQAGDCSSAAALDGATQHQRQRRASIEGLLPPIGSSATTPAPEVLPVEVVGEREEATPDDAAQLPQRRVTSLTTAISASTSFRMNAQRTTPISPPHDIPRHYADVDPKSPKNAVERLRRFSPQAASPTSSRTSPRGGAHDASSVAAGASTLQLVPFDEGEVGTATLDGKEMPWSTGCKQRGCRDPLRRQRQLMSRAEGLLVQGQRRLLAPVVGSGEGPHHPFPQRSVSPRLVHEMAERDAAAQALATNLQQRLAARRQAWKQRLMIRPPLSITGGVDDARRSDQSQYQPIPEEERLRCDEAWVHNPTYWFLEEASLAAAAGSRRHENGDAPGGLDDEAIDWGGVPCLGEALPTAIPEGDVSGSSPSQAAFQLNYIKMQKLMLSQHCENIKERHRLSPLRAQRLAPAVNVATAMTVTVGDGSFSMTSGDDGTVASRSKHHETLGHGGQHHCRDAPRAEANSRMRQVPSEVTTSTSAPMVSIPVFLNLRAFS